MDVATSAPQVDPGQPERGARQDERTWRALVVWALLMLAALLVPYQWDLVIPGIVLYFVALAQALSGVVYSSPLVDWIPVLLAAIGVIVIASCALTLLGIFRRRPGLTLIAACVYTCQSAWFFAGLQILFADPWTPRLVHPAALLLLSGMGPVWCVLHLRSPGDSDVRRARWPVVAALGLTATAALAFAWVALASGYYPFWATALWTLSLALSLLITASLSAVLRGPQMPVPRRLVPTDVP